MQYNRKPILGLDFGNTIKIIGVDSLTLGFAEAIPQAKKLFGTDIVIVSRVNDLVEGEAHVRKFMTRYGLFDLIPSDHLNFCLLRSEKAAICERLGVTHFVDDRTECLHHMKTVPYRYALNPTARQMKEFPTDSMKVVKDWFDCIRQIEGSIMAEVNATDVLRRVMSQLHSLPCCTSDFLGRDLYNDVQTVLYGGPDDEEGDDENSAE